MWHFFPKAKFTSNKHVCNLTFSRTIFMLFHINPWFKQLTVKTRSFLLAFWRLSVNVCQNLIFCLRPPLCLYKDAVGRTVKIFVIVTKPGNPWPTAPHGPLPLVPGERARLPVPWPALLFVSCIFSWWPNAVRQRVTEVGIANAVVWTFALQFETLWHFKYKTRMYLM